MAVYKHQWRRETASYWTEKNITPDDGEPIFEMDTGRFKVGDGLRSWNELPYFTPGGGSSSEPSATDLIAHIDDETPHPVYDSGPSLLSLYRNAKV